MGERSRTGTRVTALVLAAVLALGGGLRWGTVPARAAITFSYPEKEHREISEEELQDTSFDSGKLDRALSEIRTAAEEGDRERIGTLLDEITAQMDLLATRSSLAQVLSDADIGDEARQKTSQRLDALYSEKADAVDELMQELCTAGYRKLIAEKLGESFAGQYSTRGKTADEKKREREQDERFNVLARQEEALVDEAVGEMNAELRVRIAGKTWTEESLAESGPDDEEEYGRIETALEKKLNARVLPDLRELTDLRNQEAKLYGYRSYAEYADAEVYARDYGAKERRALCAAVKEELVPLAQQMALQDLVEGYEEQSEDFEAPGAEKIARDIAAPELRRLSPSLCEAMEYLIRNRTLDMDYSSTKPDDTGYTVSLYSYGSALIFDQPYGDMQTIRDFFHEFGHYNAAFHSPDHALNDFSSTDVAEIQSQALELLSSLDAGKVAGRKYGEAYRFTTVENMIATVIQSCCCDEIQRWMFHHSDATSAQLNKKAGEISAEYGLDLQYDWILSGHIVDSAMYDLSYAVSALAALQIDEQAQESRAEGVRTYLRVSAVESDLTFREVLEEAGVRDIFREKTVRGIADAVRDSSELRPQWLLELEYFFSGG